MLFSLVFLDVFLIRLVIFMKVIGVGMICCDLKSLVSLFRWGLGREMIFLFGLIVVNG